jgi:uncharacterized coiled-coil protein SlyX
MDEVPSESELSARVIDLEVQLSYAQRHAEAQDAAMHRMHKEIEQLSQRVGKLDERLRTIAEDAQDTKDASAERPPHY